ncbi:TetR/AcrR family transcriptional regulator [Limosilactobacillus reuteri]|uniref:TetR/AcrR family transcriptional regulator n=1 Tax=Limosilactobacillus reuteri TaxID=1598 RepID=UPI001E5D2C07|nr:TetR/AcrR family transcriptional regulator [Limosilactobacillus reuteri]MCC4435472.1 TetR/AcrR family transcriptional regulator [Limosilactobacillus reuteri]MCC4437654.1 TetR/AcrR family transcriptional regulator [Limosilactobacillus reuteri]MCC4442142.1 TetR/AcrR family transcriptional regulator [Limosilactobacillus reuteri]MCC4444082.1 TetR/AcrR family transcriptional regulator [Limosilactobacillus reuteri]MCC4446334.1 TetR/AcrR family transcriptional regulator [Limosilactobacillus reuter
MSQVLANYEEQLANAKMPAGKKKVLITSLKLFANNGFHATTTAKIAKEAGVSEGTIYKYFSSKDDLLAKLLQPILIEIKNNFFSNLDDKTDLPSLIKFIVTDRIHFIEVNFDFIRLIFQEILTGQLTDKSYRDFFSGNDGIFAKLKEFQVNFPEINSVLTPPQITRIFIGPILTYVLQNKLLGLPVNNDDLELIQKQIIINLTFDY